MKPKVLVGVTGGIAAYKSASLVSGLVKCGIDVYVVMTAHAAEFVQPLTFETLSGHPVVSDMFNREREWEVEHISLAKKCELIIIAPATANFVGKIASGVADDMLTTTFMASKAQKLICPAMNTNMYTDTNFQRNLQLLETQGAVIESPGCGRLACGDVGQGKMAEPEDILQKALELLRVNLDYADKKVLVTAGATIESIDGVRFLSNRSSGKMGIAIAERFADRGAEVTLVAGKITAKVPDNIAKILNVESTEDMYRAVMGAMDGMDYIVMAGAPADYMPVVCYDSKVKDKTLTLELVKTKDIAEAVGVTKSSETKLIIFSAETDNLIANATGKLKKKHADMVVANDVTIQGAGFDVDTNIVTIIKQDGKSYDYKMMTKYEVADVILSHIKEL